MESVKPGYILQVESTGCADMLDTGCKRKMGDMVTGPQSVLVPYDTSKAKAQNVKSLEEEKVYWSRRSQPGKWRPHPQIHLKKVYSSGFFRVNGREYGRGCKTQA